MFEPGKPLAGLILETKRVFLREMAPEDFDALFRVLSDPQTMWHYSYTPDGQHVRDWAFRHTDYPALYSYCKYTNAPSFRTAESIGMRFAFEYPDEANGITHVSVISREDWLKTPSSV